MGSSVDAVFDFVFRVVASVLVLVAYTLWFVGTVKRAKQLNNDINKLRGSDNDRN